MILVKYTFQGKIIIWYRIFPTINDSPNHPSRLYSNQSCSMWSSYLSYPAKLLKVVVFSSFHRLETTLWLYWHFCHIPMWLYMCIYNCICLSAISIIEPKHVSFICYELENIYRCWKQSSCLLIWTDFGNACKE